MSVVGEVSDGSGVVTKARARQKDESTPSEGRESRLQGKVGHRERCGSEFPRHKGLRWTGSAAERAPSGSCWSPDASTLKNQDGILDIAWQKEWEKGKIAPCSLWNARRPRHHRRFVWTTLQQLTCTGAHAVSRCCTAACIRKLLQPGGLVALSLLPSSLPSLYRPPNAYLFRASIASPVLPPVDR